MSLYCVGFISCPKNPAAKKIAREIIAKRLAACVNIVPAVQSVYWWKGKREVASESLLIVKTKKPLLRKLIQLIRKIHPYAVPEIIFLPIVAGHKHYLDWISAETRKR